MLAVVNFPEYEEDEVMENVEQEIDELFDYMDERVDNGAKQSDIVMAMAIVLKLITETEGNLETVH
jgi:hypothetical protein